jgi:hypothetical protein
MFGLIFNEFIVHLHAGLRVILHIRLFLINCRESLVVEMSSISFKDIFGDREETVKVIIRTLAVIFILKLFLI